MQRRLNECLDEYKRILKWLRSRSREQEADEAGVKLRKVCTSQGDLFLIGSSTRVRNGDSEVKGASYPSCDSLHQLEIQLDLLNERMLTPIFARQEKRSQRRRRQVTMETRKKSKPTQKRRKRRK